LKADGTVVSTRSGTSNWHDIVMVSASRGTVGLKVDGTVVSTRGGTDNWHDIVMVSTGVNHTLGLKTDGTVWTLPQAVNKVKQL